MASQNVAPAVVGRMIGNLVPLALLLWAAFEVQAGALRWLLIGWSCFTVLVWAGYCSLAVVKGESLRPQLSKQEAVLFESAKEQRRISQQLAAIEAKLDVFSRRAGGKGGAA